MNTTGNQDIVEGLLDGLMQVMVCGVSIKLKMWSNTQRNLSINIAFPFSIQRLFLYIFHYIIFALEEQYSLRPGLLFDTINDILIYLSKCFPFIVLSLFNLRLMLLPNSEKRNVLLDDRSHDNKSKQYIYYTFWR